MQFYRYNKEDMTFTKVSIWRYVILFVCMLTLMSTSKSSKVTNPDYEREPSIVSIFTSDLEFNKENLMIVIKSCGIRYPDIVMSQSILETGSFRSSIFKEANNLFGMKLARSRPTTAIGEYSGHAMYDHWTQSVMDYALYQSAYLRKLKTREQYYDYLSQNYAEDPNYVTKLKRYEEKN